MELWLGARSADLPRALTAAENRGKLCPPDSIAQERCSTRAPATEARVEQVASSCIEFRAALSATAPVQTQVVEQVRSGNRGEARSSRRSRGRVVAARRAWAGCVPKGTPDRRRVEDSRSAARAAGPSSRLCIRLFIARHFDSCGQPGFDRAARPARRVPGRCWRLAESPAVLGSLAERWARLPGRSPAYRRARKDRPAAVGEGCLPHRAGAAPGLSASGGSSNGEATSARDRQVGPARRPSRRGGGILLGRPSGAPPHPVSPAGQRLDALNDFSSVGRLRARAAPAVRELPPACRMITEILSACSSCRSGLPGRTEPAACGSAPAGKARSAAPGLAPASPRPGSTLPEPVLGLDSSSLFASLPRPVAVVLVRLRNPWAETIPSPQAILFRSIGSLAPIASEKLGKTANLRVLRN